MEWIQFQLFKLWTFNFRLSKFESTRMNELIWHESLFWVETTKVERYLNQFKRFNSAFLKKYSPVNYYYYYYYYNTVISSFLRFISHPRPSNIKFQVFFQTFYGKMNNRERIDPHEKSASRCGIILRHREIVIKCYSESKSFRWCDRPHSRCFSNSDQQYESKHRYNEQWWIVC